MVLIARRVLVRLSPLLAVAVVASLMVSEATGARHVPDATPHVARTIYRHENAAQALATVRETFPAQVCERVQELRRNHAGPKAERSSGHRHELHRPQYACRGSPTSVWPYTDGGGRRPWIWVWFGKARRSCREAVWWACHYRAHRAVRWRSPNLKWPSDWQAARRWSGSEPAAACSSPTSAAASTIPMPSSSRLQREHKSRSCCARRPASNLSGCSSLFRPVGHFVAPRRYRGA